MNVITIDESFAEKDFLEGNPVQVRVTIKGDEPEYEKGSEVQIVHQEQYATARIVSDPLLISEEENEKVYSLIIARSNSTLG